MGKITKNLIGLWMSIFLLFTVAESGQCSDNQPMKMIAKRVQQLEQSQTVFKPVNIFSISGNQEDDKISQTVNAFTILDVNNTSINALLQDQPDYIRIQLPAKAGLPTLEAMLYKVDISKNGFTLQTDKGIVNQQPNINVHYRGIIAGDYTSVVSMSFSKEEIMGILSDARGNFVIGEIESSGRSRYLLYNDKDLIPAVSFGCGTNTSQVVTDYEQQQLQNNLPGIASVNCVNWYYETDYDIFVGKGSLANVNTYMQGVFNQVATLYDNDGVSITLQTLFVWTSTDPYTGPASGDYLNQFGAYRTSFNGDLANLVGYNGGGGVAYVNQLCSSNTALKMGYSGINSSYNTVPTYSWTVEVITHEDGHLLGSRHTHDCVWNGNNTRIDGCGPQAGYNSGSCAAGPIPADGTIMSYCHLISAGINFSLGFGPQPAALILNNVNNASCLVACGPCPTPPQPGTISGSSTVCTASQFTYSVAAVPGATSYIWTLPAGWSGTSTTNSITVTTTSSGGTISVAAVNSCGSGTARTLAITGGSAPTQPGIITGNTSVCANTSYSYSVPAVPGATSYIWTIPAGWSGTSSTNNITLLSGTTGGSLAVVAVNSCGNSVARSTSLTISPVPAQPSVITGNVSVCPGSTQVYSVTFVQGANMIYNWTLPSGWSGSSSGNSITTIAGTTGGTISVNASNSCGAGQSRTLSVATFPLPAKPSGITTAGGAVKVCPGDIKTYSISATSGATSYTWTAPPGATITSGQGTTSVVVNYGAGFTANDSLKVVANNSCGSGPMRFLKITRNNPATPSVITGLSYGLCNAANQTFSVTNVNGINYNWSFNNATANIVNGQGSNSINASFTPNFSIANLSVAATNGCGSSAQRTLTLRATPALPGLISGSATVCANQQNVPYTTTPVAGATSYTWQGPTGSRISDGVVTSTTTILTTTSTSVTVNYATAAGNLKVKANNACGSSGNRVLAIAINCREQLPVSTNEFAVNVFPNPASDFMHITFECKNNSGYLLIVSDISGKILQTETGETIEGINEAGLNVSNLPNGIYFMELISNNKRSIQKISIQK